MLIIAPAAVSSLFLAAFFSAAASFLLTPAFRIIPIQSTMIAGVDFITFSIFSRMITPVSVSFYISAGAGLLVLLISHLRDVKRWIIALAITSTDAFLGIYVYFFFTNIFFYYTKTFVYLVRVGSEYFISTFFLVFMIFTVIFYIFSYIVFLKETYLEYKMII